jgi:hypothetical protein
MDKFEDSILPEPISYAKDYVQIVWWPLCFIERGLEIVSEHLKLCRTVLAAFSAIKKAWIERVKP